LRYLSHGAISFDRTPLNFFAAAFFPGRFTAMNSPEFLLRFVQPLAPLILVLTWLRFLTAPVRALSPTGLSTAIFLLRASSKKKS